MESYIVNIYKRERELNMIVGVVEKVGEAVKQSFQTSEGLLALLRADGDRDRRREGRLNIILPVVVEGAAEKGGYFREETVLQNLSSHGACLLLSREIEPGACLLMIFDPDKTACEKTVTVVRSTDRSGIYEIGVSFVPSIIPGA